MKKWSVVFVVALILSFSTPSLALGVMGEVFFLTDQETSAGFVPERAYRGELSFLRLGPIKAVGEFQYAGEREDLYRLMDLVRQKELNPDDFSKDMIMVSDFATKVRMDWPLLRGNTIIGTVGYRANGYLQAITPQQVESDLSYGLHHGLTYGAGMGLEIARGLMAYGIYEMAPNLKSSYGTAVNEKGAMWNSIDVGLEYSIPFFVAKAGYRVQDFKASDFNYTFKGVFVGAGVQF